ncbi:polymeric immunoglobulin receptor-like [Thunnus thynnus]|uniref:polymeric immunoglobulin receptor-like n=1 Tax=Thunnus thynnus TaxID=8237 RepID=UPI003528FCA2
MAEGRRVMGPGRRVVPVGRFIFNMKAHPLDPVVLYCCNYHSQDRQELCDILLSLSKPSEKSASQSKAPTKPSTRPIRQASLSLQDGNTGLINAIDLFAGAEGGNGSWSCHFTSSGSTKFFCKGECKEEDILIKTDNVTDQSGRYSIKYKDGSSGRRTVTVTITQLTKSDSGRYRCGLGGSSVPDDYSDFDITITDEATLGQNTRFIRAVTVGGNITRRCHNTVNGSRKFFCKDECKKEEDILVKTEENRAQNGRYSIEYREGSEYGLYVTITQLKKSDTGRYRCGYGRALSPDSSNTLLIFVVDAPTTSKPNWTLRPFPTSVPSASTPTTTQSLISSSGSFTPSSSFPETTEQFTGTGQFMSVHLSITVSLQQNVLLKQSNSA